MTFTIIHTSGFRLPKLQDPDLFSIAPRTLGTEELSVIPANCPL